MIENGAARMSESGSPAESLLSFLNTASSSVKNVLARPGCFKRNTNHRRFLQKQLKVTTRGSEPLAGKQEMSKKQFALSKMKQKHSVKRRSDDVFSDDATVTPRKRINAVTKEQFTAKRSLVSKNEVQKELQYLDECKRFSAMVDDLVDNLLDSSSQSTNHQRFENESAASHPYTRSGSISSSYSSASEEEIIPDFMSGEELLRSLDISELFIPEGHSSPVQERFVRPEQHNVSDNDYQMVPGNDSPVHEHYMYETDLIDVQSMPVFENVFRQFSL